MFVHQNRIRYVVRRLAAGSLAALLLFGTDLPANGQLNGPLNLGGQQSNSLTIQAEFTAATDDKPAMLFVRATIDPGWHVYSISQQPGGPIKTEIKVAPSDQYELTGPFRANQEPIVSFEEFWPGLPIEEHEGQVVWYAPLKLADGVDPSTLTLHGTVKGQVCQDSGSCVQFEEKFAAKLGKGFDVAAAAGGPPPLEGPTSVGSYRAEDSGVTISGEVAPSVVAPGGTARLTFTAAPDEGYHTYARADRDPDLVGQGKPTLIVVENSAGLTVHSPTTDAPVEEKPAAGPDGGTERFHKGDVTWTIELGVPADATPGKHTIAGILGYQVCRDTSCLMPEGARFQVQLDVADDGSASSATDKSDTTPVTFAPAKYAEAAQGAKELTNTLVRPQDALLDASLAFILGSAFLGGIILNFMPCVLPVIGLKVLAFVEQGGRSRLRTFALNVSYSIGLLSVFIILATLAASVQLGIGSALGIKDQGFGWGEQFTYTPFKVALAALVFVMALSFLGTWEMPIPGFAGRGKAAELAAREDMLGAFFKGVFATILATPCSAPLLGTIFGYATTQPVVVIYSVFISIGLGMAAPYLIAGAFPRLLSFLPKPGAWMETFKQLMAFLLLGTVVYLIYTINDAHRVPTLALLVALWFACWWIGRIPITASFTRKLTAWVGGLAVSLLVGYIMFVPNKYELPWQPYSPAALARNQSEGKTVLVDFTANWCPNCKLNLHFALNTKDVDAFVKENGIVPLVADWTDKNDMIKKALADLNSASIPLLAIYPADDPQNPIVLRDIVTEGQVLEALKKAGPSKDASAADPSEQSKSPVASLP